MLKKLNLAFKVKSHCAAQETTSPVFHSLTALVTCSPPCF